MFGDDLEYRESGDIEWIDAEHSGITPSITLLDLDYNATYEVRVRAVNALGHSVFSGIAVGQTLRVATPTDLSTSDIRGNGFTANWSEVVGADYYTIQYKHETSEDWTWLLERGDLYDLRKITALSDGVSVRTTALDEVYNWRVRATDDVGDETYVSEWSSPLFVTLASKDWAISHLARRVQTGNVATGGDVLAFLYDTTLFSSDRLFTFSKDDGSIEEFYYLPERAEWGRCATDGTTFWAYSRLAEDRSTGSYPFFGTTYDPRVYAYDLNSGNRVASKEPEDVGGLSYVPNAVGYYQNKVYLASGRYTDDKGRDYFRLAAYSANDGRRLASADKTTLSLDYGNLVDISITPDGIVSLFGTFRFSQYGSYHNRIAFDINRIGNGWRGAYSLAIDRHIWSGASDGKNIYISSRGHNPDGSLNYWTLHSYYE